MSDGRELEAGGQAMRVWRPNPFRREVWGVLAVLVCCACMLVLGVSRLEYSGNRRGQTNFATAVALRRALLQFCRDNDFIGEGRVTASLLKELRPDEVRMDRGRILFRCFVYEQESQELSIYGMDPYETLDVRFQVTQSLVNTPEISSVRIIRGRLGPTLPRVSK